MSLPVISGRGFLLTNGVELKFSKSGLAYARLPLSFKNSKRTPEGSWKHTKEVVVEGTVFGALAEALAEMVTTQQELFFSGEVFLEEHDGKRYVKANVHTAWPVKETLQTAAAGSSRGSSNGDLPF